MQDTNVPRLAKWPFFVGSILSWAVAWIIYHQIKGPIGAGVALAFIASVALGGYFIVWPYVLEYRSASKLVETGALTSVVSQVQNLEEVAGRIGSATAQWQTVQESADKTARQAKEIAQNMGAEVKAFSEFLAQANDSERATLRLEVDKLRRIEAEWVQVLVRILDHVYALTRAATQSRQQNVIEQLGRFQSACHDAARRVGLSPFVAAAEEKFDGRKHQVVGDGAAAAGDGSVVEETVASGYTFQGKLLRPALVRLRNGNQAPTPPEPTTETTSTSQATDSELPLG